MAVSALKSSLKYVLLSFVGLADRVVPKSHSVLFRSFPDVCDQGRETVAALARGGVGPVTWMVADVKDPLIAGVPCRLVSSRSPRALWAYWRARVVVHTHGVLGSRPASRRKRFVNIWHGMPIKLLEHDSAVGHFQTDLTIATASVHATHLARTWGIDEARVELTGLPRNDVLARPRPARPAWLVDLAGDRPLVVWLPTYRRAVTGTIRAEGTDTGTATQFEGATVDSVDELMGELGAFCMVKIHPLADQLDRVDRPNVVCLPDAGLRGFGITLYELLSQADVLITDHSSVWIDFLLTQRPIVFTISDAERYESTRGYYFDDLLALLPGPIVDRTEDLEGVLRPLLSGRDDWVAERRAALGTHHLHADAGSADRVACVVARELRHPTPR